MVKLLKMKDTRMVGGSILLLGSLYLLYRYMRTESFMDIRKIPDMTGYNQYVDEMRTEHKVIRTPDSESNQVVLVPKDIYGLSMLWRKNIAFQDDLLEDRVYDSVVGYKKIPQNFHPDHTRIGNNDSPLMLEIMEVAN